QGGSASAEAPPGSVASLASVDWFTPQATQATESVPSAYAEGCQQNQTDAEVIMCEYGDLDSDTVIAVVGDSKVLQWQSAIEQIANDEGWHVQSYTKSSCVFSAGMQTDEGQPYTSCQQWNENVLAELIELDPDAVVVSGRTTTALEDWTDPDTGSHDVMTQALTEQWTDLTDADIPVVTILDTPSPGDLSVYECVADNLDNLQACTFDRKEGIAASQAPQQRAAAEEVPDVELVDMTDQICPEETCVPVIGNVLVYRQTSHVTDTYVRTLTPDLADRLVPAVDEAVAES
ncbi:SGNH hydrolase domain-containing protein, partial [Ruania albidiflava]|uniref:SGNH hydrolase domain-containing protein n=1 Tax=Ruania albidiflava TaxID=366586 RepID=UPI00247FB0A8